MNVYAEGEVTNESGVIVLESVWPAWNGGTNDHIEIDTANNRIVVSGTKNTDYPSTPQQIFDDLTAENLARVALGQTVIPITPDQLRSYKKKFYLQAAAATATTWKEAPLYAEIPFYIQYTLNCMKDVVFITEANQSGNEEVIQWPDIQLSMQFNKVDISGADDQNCDIETFINLSGNQGYRLA